MEIRLQRQSQRNPLLGHSSHKNNIRHFLKKLPISNSCNLFFRNKRKEEVPSLKCKLALRIHLLNLLTICNLICKILSSIAIEQKHPCKFFLANEVSFFIVIKSPTKQQHSRHRNDHLQNVNTQNKAPSILE
jgi:hypothetical protein